jgi:hypothetical protein
MFAFSRETEKWHFERSDDIKLWRFSEDSHSILLLHLDPLRRRSQKLCQISERKYREDYRESHVTAEQSFRINEFLNFRLVWKLCHVTSLRRRKAARRGHPLRRLTRILLMIGNDNVLRFLRFLRRVVHKISFLIRFFSGISWAKHFHSDESRSAGWSLRSPENHFEEERNLEQHEA